MNDRANIFIKAVQSLVCTLCLGKGWVFTEEADGGFGLSFTIHKCEAYQKFSSDFKALLAHYKECRDTNCVFLKYHEKLE